LTTDKRRLYSLYSNISNWMFRSSVVFYFIFASCENEGCTSFKSLFLYNSSLTVKMWEKKSKRQH